MSETVNLPALGESVTEGTVTRWLKAVGDEVAVDEPLVEVSTDKVDTEIPSPVAGVLEEILVEEDDTVEVGAPLATIGDGSGGGSADASEDDAAAEEPAVEEAQQDDAQQEPAGEPAPEERASTDQGSDGAPSAGGEASEVTLPALHEGLERSGRERSDVVVHCPGFVVVTGDAGPSEAETLAVRRQIAFYGSTPAYADVLRRAGRGELHDRLHALSVGSDPERWARMGDLVDDELRVGAAARVGAHRRAHPVGQALGRVLAVELLPLDPVPEALEGDRAVLQRVADEPVTDGDDVVGELALGDRRAVLALGPHDLVRAGEPDLPGLAVGAGDLEDRRSAHLVRLALGRGR